ncbi:MAG: response regulator [Calditrichota bacterium]
MADPKRILIIDDEPDTITYFTSVLEDQGYTIFTAMNGETGLNAALEHKPDLVTLDISMPEKSGVKCYREFKGNPDLKNIPIIIITGVSEDFKTFISTRKQVPPPEGYLSKPVTAEELAELARKLIK